jgi:hypothetical protein
VGTRTLRKPEGEPAEAVWAGAGASVAAGGGEVGAGEDMTVGLERGCGSEQRILARELDNRGRGSGYEDQGHCQGGGDRRAASTDQGRPSHDGDNPYRSSGRSSRMYWPYSTPACLATEADDDGQGAEQVVFDRSGERMLVLGPDRLALYRTKARRADCLPSLPVDLAPD